MTIKQVSNRLLSIPGICECVWGEVDRPRLQGCREGKVFAHAVWRVKVKPVVIEFHLPRALHQTLQLRIGGTRVVRLIHAMKLKPRRLLRVVWQEASEGRPLKP